MAETHLPCGWWSMTRQAATAKALADHRLPHPNQGGGLAFSVYRRRALMRLGFSQPHAEPPTTRRV